MLQITGAARNHTAKTPVTPQGLKTLILKLRWAGLDQDADELCLELEHIAPEDCIPLGPAETD
ncbi:MAG: hypothetical protein ABSD21_11425 [Rhizomicrobium sp.]|jgi:hypothetical protein